MILLGAGHAHLLLTERLDALREVGIDPLLIAPRWFDYSGLATGVLSGALAPGANRIDVAAVASRRGLAFVEGFAVAIDRAAQTLTLADGSQHSFNFLSLNIGSVVEPSVAGNDVRPVKPLAGLTDLRVQIESRAEFPHVLIVGAGPSGTEVAAALLGLAERTGVKPRITLAGRTAIPGRAWRSLYASLECRGLTLHPGEAPLPEHDLMIVATGLRAPSLVREAGLAIERDGGAAVAATLQSLVDPAIFAVGDCADFQPRTLPRQGVFGVRQAPVLARNLAAAAQGRLLEDYRPQGRWLAIMDLGNATGFATWGGLAWRSRAMLRWKRRLDLSFVRRFR
ncbi:MAG: FAD-dependent oxidoreductase [Sphingomonas bacterium]|nr:FAD-dependent oxidoreductase [Sphingomonas bacterium]